jgi:CRISPR system Cascade subunit CasC
MANILELHILQNLAPCNINRDDTGAPKDAIFGGVRRARISSQSLKRAMRRYFASQKLLPAESLAVRSRNLVGELTTRLVKRGIAEPGAAIEAALGLIDLAVKSKGPDGPAKTEYLLFLGRGEITALEELIAANAEVLASGKPDKQLKGQVTKCIGSSPAADISLFGRMLADRKDFNVDAACQVAHAISTNRVDREFDFFTAVDDLPIEDEAVSGMLGTVEFNSACYYRYIVINLDKLLENLDGADRELAVNTAVAATQAAIMALPTGKQNTFAAHNPPEFVGVRVRRDTGPLSLANAFERPVTPTESKGGVTAASVTRLQQKWSAYAEAFGGEGVDLILDLTAAWQGSTVKSVGELVEAVRRESAKLLGA